MVNEALSSLAMAASSAAYNVVADGNGGFTLSGKDAADVAYNFDANGVLVANADSSTTGLEGFTVERGFIDNTTGFKAVALFNPVTEEQHFTRLSGGHKISIKDWTKTQARASC